MFPKILGNKKLEFGQKKLEFFIFEFMMVQILYISWNYVDIFKLLYLYLDCLNLKNVFFFLFFPVSTHGGLSDPADQNHHVVKRQIDNRRVVCYYANWAVYRKGTAKFTPQNINPYLCTHLIYAFAGLGKDDTIQTFDKYQDLEKGKLRN